MALLRRGLGLGARLAVRSALEGRPSVTSPAYGSRLGVISQQLNVAATSRLHGQGPQITAQEEHCTNWGHVCTTTYNGLPPGLANASQAGTRVRRDGTCGATIWCSTAGTALTSASKRASSGATAPSSCTAPSRGLGHLRPQVQPGSGRQRGTRPIQCCDQDMLQGGKRLSMGSGIVPSLCTSAVWQLAQETLAGVRMHVCRRTCARGLFGGGSHRIRSARNLGI